MGRGLRDDDYGRLGLAAAMVALAMLVYLATCGTAKAAPYRVDFQNPGSTRAFDSIGVCRASGCVEIGVACAPGETCSTLADIPIGTHEVWLVGGNGPDRTAPSNVLEIVMAEGCQWNLDAAGGVAVADFGIFLARFRSGLYTVADFGRFLAAFSTPGLVCP